ncbi:MAG: radical SAM protein [Lachnospiraceae bacterium]|nr:radical SAM protein [Lachnospiraceae bacterium]
MIKAIILGHNVYGSYMKQFIDRGYNRIVDEYGGEEIEPVAYWDYFGSTASDDADLPVLDHEMVRAFFEDGSAEILIVPQECYVGLNDYLTAFILIGIDLGNVYIAKSLDRSISSKDEIMDMFTPYYSCGTLPYMEFHVADHCNLNCANCEHYSGLVKEPVFPDFEKFTNDLHQLRKYIDTIGLIRILGGEPLLNPQVEDYIKLVSEVYPESVIRVVTNALLLRSMPDSFFETLNSCREGSGVHISLYPVMKDHIDPVISLLKEKGTTYAISPLMETFRKQQSLIPADDEELAQKYTHCYQKGCVNLYDGKLASCFLPFTTKYFNEYFGKNLPEDGAVDLYEDGLVIEKIMHRLSTPFERCRYCREAVEQPWHVIHEPSILEDWV